MARILDQHGVPVLLLAGWLPISVRWPAEPGVQTLVQDPARHLIAVVPLQAGDLGAGDDVAQADNQPDLVLALFGVFGRRDRFPGIAEDEELDVRIAQGIEDLAHEIPEAIQVVDDQDVEGPA